MSRISRILLLICTSYCQAYDPSVIMPYKEILGSSLDINKIGNNILCTDARENLQTCAEDCFLKDDKSENCVGFLQDGNSCYFCKVSNRTEIDSNLYTNFTSSHELYLLKSQKIEPNIYISMDEFDLSTGTIIGKGVSGGSNGITADDLIPGKVGQAIHFGGTISPSVGQQECYCSFYYCNGTMSLSFWARTQGSYQGQSITPQAFSSLTVTVGSLAAGWFNSEGKYLDGYGITSILSSTE